MIKYSKKRYMSLEAYYTTVWTLCLNYKNFDACID